jgi:hypothetical protein
MPPAPTMPITDDSRKLMSSRYTDSPTKRGMICGTTPYPICWNQEPPVARIASSCVGSMSSMSSASSLPRKPMLANASVRTPASGTEADHDDEEDGDHDLLERARHGDDARQKR